MSRFPSARWLVVLASWWIATGMADEPPAGSIWQPAADAIGPRCDATLAKAREHLQTLETLPLAKAGVKTVLGPWNELDQLLQDAGNPLGLLAEVSPDAAVRTAAEKCVLRLSGFENEIFQNVALYRRLKAVKATEPVDVSARRLLTEEFEDRGVNLKGKKRARAKAIFDRIDKLQQDFSRNLRENQTKLEFTAVELRGVPDRFLAKATRGPDGRYRIGFDYPEIDAVMGNAENGDTRRRYQYALSRRGTEQNLAILGEVVTLRKELATLLGYPSYASWSLRRKMVEKPEVVEKFLADVGGRVEQVEKKELAILAGEKARHVDKTDGLKRWDVLFYEQRLKRTRFSVDPETVRAQFPTTPTVDWCLNVTSKLYGVEFRPNARLPVWHTDVRGYDVYDRSTKRYLGTFYLDLFPRAGKYKHAAAFGVRGVSTALDRTPVSVLVTNFSRDGLDQRELETLFHEFGHVMHGVLSRTRYLLHAGTAVKRDFVEAPSQMYEEWARRPESLALYADTCPKCKPIDPKLMERMDAARRFGQGTMYARQRLYAQYDMALASSRPGDPMQVWADMEGHTPLGHVPGTQFPGTFGHIVGGYAAGYYGYMWSEVLALDMLSPFGNNVMDSRVGRRFRDIVLANGGQVAPMKLVEQFLGREPSPDAFFREITGQRGSGPSPAAPGNSE